MFTKFGTEVDIGRPRFPVTSNSTSKKSKMAATAIFKIHFNGRNSVAIARIHTVFGTKIKSDVWKQKYLQISLLPKSKMAAGRHFENT